MIRIIIGFVTVILLLSACGGENKPVQKSNAGNDLIYQMGKAIKADPTNAELLFNRANAYYDIEDFEASINDLKNAMKIDSLKPEYHHLLADNYLDYFRSRDALTTMENVVRMYPERIPSLLKLAEMQYLLKQNDNSVLTINSILMRSPRNSEAYFMLGLNFRATEDIKRAINSLQTAVEIDPELTDGWILLGDLHDQISSEDAIKFYDNALLVDPDRIESKHSKAFYLQNHGDIQGALEIYKDIVVNNPNYTGAYLNAGILYLEMDSIDNAYEQFNILAGVQPENHLAYYYRGLINAQKGEMTAAKEDLQTVLRLSPQFERAREALAEIKE